jgi:hypothetical protein
MARKLTDTERADRAVLESAFQAKVIRFARKRGWRAVHFYQAIVAGTPDAPVWATPVSGDADGFPDVIFVKPGRQPIFAEFKRVLTHPTPKQWAWLDILIAAGQVAVVWKPDQWKEIQAVLAA